MSLPMRPGDAVDARAGAGGAGFSDADSRWIEAFEAATLRDGAFHHRDHVRTAWIYLRRFPPAAALDRFARGLRRFAAEKGKPGLYHETITWAYLLLIRERMERDGSEGSFDEFAARHPDLLAWNPSILDSYYRRETLWSDLARRVFVFPDASGEASLSRAELFVRGVRNLREGSGGRPRAAGAEAQRGIRRAVEPVMASRRRCAGGADSEQAGATDCPRPRGSSRARCGRQPGVPDERDV